MYLRSVPCLPQEEICDPQAIAEAIGRVVLEEDEVEEKGYCTQARLVAVTIGLALTDAEESSLVASSIALLAIPPEKNGDT